MRARWSQSFPFTALDSNWDDMPSSSGVYVVRRKKPVPRVAGVDRSGVLYVGQARNLRSRLYAFWDAYHTASGFLWEHRHLAGPVFGGTARTQEDVVRLMARLTFRFAGPLWPKELQRAERALLFAYINRFGEAPPLNLSLVQRWQSQPNAADLRWAEPGVLHRS